MKKTFSIIGKSIIIILTVWFFLSWFDIMADNSAPNPKHADWNMFTVLFPVAEETREEDCRVTAINYINDIVTFIDTQGHVWIAEVDEASKYHIDGLHTLTYKVNNPTDKYDDEIIDIN